ncbi:MAG TPA: hypothetical protein VGN64_25335 [Dyadobacter sp.]|nr:hypothetical protein [Dyadobacter sp.]
MIVFAWNIESWIGVKTSDYGSTNPVRDEILVETRLVMNNVSAVGT